MPHLTDADKEFFKENGYLVVRGALSQNEIDAALDRVWDSIDEDRNDSESWIRKGYRTAPIGGEDVIRGTIYGNSVFAMAEEMVGEGKLHNGGGAGPHLNFPDPDREWREPLGHLDGYHTPSNGVPKGLLVHLHSVQPFIWIPLKNTAVGLLFGLAAIASGQSISDTTTWTVFPVALLPLIWDQVMNSQVKGEMSVSGITK